MVYIFSLWWYLLINGNLNFKRVQFMDFFVSWFVLVSYLNHPWQSHNKSDVLIRFSLKALCCITFTFTRVIQVELILCMLWNRRSRFYFFFFLAKQSYTQPRIVIHLITYHLLISAPIIFQYIVLLYLGGILL